MGRYEDYNEMLYEAYCKAAIDNAILKALPSKMTPSKERNSQSSSRVFAPLTVPAM